MLTVDNPSVPFSSKIVNGLPYGAEVYLTGEAIHGREKGIWFEYKSHDGRIPFHLNIRMDSGQNNQNVIIMNSYQHGSWGHEQHEFNPVSSGGSVHIHVSCNEEFYNVTINRTNSFRFLHRMKIHEIDELIIRGDLEISRVTFQNMENHIQFVDHLPGYSPYGSTLGQPSPLGQTSPLIHPTPLGQGSIQSRPSPSPLGQSHGRGQPNPTPLGQGRGLGQPKPSVQDHGLGQPIPLGQGQGLNQSSPVGNALNQAREASQSTPLGQGQGLQPSPFGNALNQALGATQNPPSL